MARRNAPATNGFFGGLAGGRLRFFLGSPWMFGLLVELLEEAEVKRSVWVQMLTGFAAIATTGGLIAACAHDDSTVFIRGVQAPPSTLTGGVCLFTPDPGGAFLSTGVFDVAFTGSYEAETLVGSQLISQANHDLVRTESANVTLQGAIVRLTDASGTEIKSFTSLSSGFVSPGNGTTASYGTIGVTLVDPATSDLIRATLPARGSKLLVAYFKIFGQTLGGTSVETDEFQFPINVCNGCLVVFPAGSQDDALAFTEGKPNCKSKTAATTMSATPCIAGQDVPIDCRLCQGFAVCDPANP